MCQTSAGWVQEERKHVCHTIIGFRLILTFVQGCWSANFNHPRVDRNTSSGMLFGISEHDGVENDCSNRLFHLPTRKVNAKRSVLFSGGPFKDRGAWNNAASSWMWRPSYKIRTFVLLDQDSILFIANESCVWFHRIFMIRRNPLYLATGFWTTLFFCTYTELHLVWYIQIRRRILHLVRIKNLTLKALQIQSERRDSSGHYF